MTNFAQHSQVNIDKMLTIKNLCVKITMHKKSALLFVFFDLEKYSSGRSRLRLNATSFGYKTGHRQVLLDASRPLLR